MHSFHTGYSSSDFRFRDGKQLSFSLVCIIFIYYPTRKTAENRSTEMLLGGNYQLYNVFQALYSMNKH